MQIQRQQYTEAGATLSYPAFVAEQAADIAPAVSAQTTAPAVSADTAPAASAADARRMTAFYEYMKDCVLEYCHSEAFPTGGRYYVDYRVTEVGAGYDVEIFLRLRIRGRSVGSACLSHRWRDGVLDLQKPERVCRRNENRCKR